MEDNSRHVQSKSQLLNKMIALMNGHRDISELLHDFIFNYYAIITPSAMDIGMNDYVDQSLSTTLTIKGESFSSVRVSVR